MHDGAEMEEVAVTPLGRYEVVVDPMGLGLTLHYNGEDTNVSVSLSPSESLQLASLVTAHQAQLEAGQQHEDAIMSVNGGNPVTLHMDHPQPIPPSSSMQG